MRTSVPVDNFGALSLPLTKVDVKKERQLAGVAKSRQWKEIKDVMVQKQMLLKQELYNKEFGSLPMDQVGYRFLAGREVILAFDEIINLVENVYSAIKSE